MAVDTPIKNFAEIEKLVRDDSKRASSYVKEWLEYAKDHPQVAAAKTREEFINLGGAPADLNKFVGREIQLSFPDIRPEIPQAASGLPSAAVQNSKIAKGSLGLLAAPLLAIPKQKQIIEEDKEYRKARREVAKEWHEEHQVK